jgi:hypothetical protein
MKRRRGGIRDEIQEDWKEIRKMRQTTCGQTFF